MMKNFTKILLGLIALATSLTANANEWRVVSCEDFGGNDNNDPVICTTAPHDKDADQNNGFYTPLKFSGVLNPSPGIYMVIKSTELADNGRGVKLTTCSGGGSCWQGFGDHTNPSDQNKGYFMVFDCTDDNAYVDEYSNLILYKKSLEITCTGVQFRFKAYMASASQWGGNTVRLSIQDETGADIVTPLNTDLAQNNITPGEWKEIEMEVSLPSDKTFNKVYFVILATSVNASGYDFALDDITIEVNQPELNISASKYEYKKPVTLSADYTQSEFDDFFGASNTDVVYQWFFKKEGDSNFTKVGSGSYTSGSPITYTINSFTKENDNGTYKLIVSTSANTNNNLCSVQKEFVINENKNKLTVDICQDSSKVIEGHTVTWNQGYSDASLEISVNNIPYTPLTDKIDPQCQNSSYPTLGKIALPDIIEKDPVTGCPQTIQKHFLNVTDEIVTDEPAHKCEGDTYKSDNNVNKVWTVVDETVGTEIKFDEDNCRHKQLVFVHPIVEEDTTVYLCKGDIFSKSGVTYSTAGTFSGSPYTSKTQWGCKKTVTPTIVVDENEGEIDEVHCPSDNYTANGIVYNYPITTRIAVPSGKTIHGCDSTTYVNLEVKEGGVITLDTLICREQILFGKEYTDAGSFTHTVKGFTESGCQKDTVWNITVVEIKLKLRMFNNQTTVCKGQPSNFEPTITADYDYTYHWEPSVPDNSFKPVLYLDSSSTYTIFADMDLPSDIDKDAKGCHAKASKTITVNPMPELSIESVDNETRTVEYTVTDGTMPYHVYVVPEKNSTSKKDYGTLEENEGTLEKQPFGDHLLQIQDSTGCMTEKPFKIEATEPEPMGFFSPNGDGENDRWMIKNVDIYEKATVRIFDRFGKLILESSAQDFESGWDGTYKGKQMPTSDYWYEIDIDEIDRQYVGHFTLIH